MRSTILCVVELYEQLNAMCSTTLCATGVYALYDYICSTTLCVEQTPCAIEVYA